MTRTFCDHCTQELTDLNSVKNAEGRLTGLVERNRNKLLFQVTTGKDATWNNGDWCKYCIIDAINTLDDRPKAVRL